MNITHDNETYWHEPTCKPAGWGCGNVILTNPLEYDWINKWDCAAWKLSKTDREDEELAALFSDCKPTTTVVSFTDAMEPNMKKAKHVALAEESDKTVKKQIVAARLNASSSSNINMVPEPIQQWLNYLDEQKAKGLIGLIPRPLHVESAISFYSWFEKKGSPTNK